VKKKLLPSLIASLTLTLLSALPIYFYQALIWKRFEGESSGICILIAKIIHFGFPFPYIILSGNDCLGYNFVIQPMVLGFIADLFLYTILFYLLLSIKHRFIK
jgi:hypothetical protein